MKTYKSFREFIIPSTLTEVALILGMSSSVLAVGYAILNYTPFN